MSLFWENIDIIEAQLDKIVDSGSDDEIFIASYFHGHFSLAESRVPELNEATDDKMAHLRQILTHNLTEAFANRELDDADQHKIWALFERLV